MDIIVPGIGSNSPSPYSIANANPGAMYSERLMQAVAKNYE